MSVTDQLVKAGNSALNLNPPTGLDLHLTPHGSDWWWAVFACFGCLLILNFIFVGVSKQKKLLFGISQIPVIFEFVAYFAMASNLGWAGVETEFGSFNGNDSPIRQIFYAKYIAWVFAFPTFLLYLDFAANETDTVIINGSFLVQIACQWLGVWTFAVNLLIGSLIHSTYKWGFFVFGVFGCFFAIGLVLYRMIAINNGRILMIFFGFFSGLIWVLYLLAWGLSEGGNVITSDSEAVFYGILDLILFGLIPMTINFALKLENPLTIALPERIIEKQIIKTVETQRTSGETATPESV